METMPTPDSFLSVLFPAMIAGIPRDAYLMWIVGAFYLLATLVMVNSYFLRHNKLTFGFFMYLLGMTLMSALVGYAMWVGDLFFLRLSFFPAIFGSSFLARAPLTMLFGKLGDLLFYVLLVVSLALGASLFVFDMDMMMSMEVMMYYMLGVAGLFAGGFLVLLGLTKVSNKADRVRSVGGGAAVMSCCFLSHMASLSSMGAVFGALSLLSTVFAALSPVILIWSLYYARKVEASSKSRSSKSR